MSNKVRVYEVARDLGMDNKALVALFQSIGVSEVRNHMSAVAPEAVERVKRHLEQSDEKPVVEERIRPTVVKRRAKRKPAASSPTAAAEPQSESRPAAAKPAPKPVPKAEPKPAPPQPAQKAAPEKPAPAAAKKPAPAAQPAAEAKAPEKQTAPAEQQPAAEKKATPAEPAKKPEPAEAKQPTEAAKPAAAAPAAAAPKPAPKPQPAAAEKKPEPAAAKPAAPAEKKPEPEEPKPRPSSPPKTGIDVWEGRPGVPMPQPPRSTPRRVQYDAKAGGGPRGPQRGGPMMRGGRFMRRNMQRRTGGGQILTKERSAHKKIVKIEGQILANALANEMAIRAPQMLKKLMELGMTGININSTLDAETAKIVPNEFGWEVEDVAVSEEEAIVKAQGLQTGEDDEKDLEPRAPVVTVMGHVDHGKTSLLDKIRKANVASGEAGGITQHIGAYSVKTAKGRITFLDTPGHAAFTQMRARGAQTTDVVILVVAADDGVMPQTKEAIDHARAANVPIVVAVNKCDKEDAQPERVRRELSEVGLVPEEWGGETLFCEVSALTGDGIDTMLEQVALQSELLELRANPKKPAAGVVIEAKLDRGRGPLATVLVLEGILKKGDAILAGGAYGKIRAMLDASGKQLKMAGPSTPAAIVGLSEVPGAGDPVHVVQNVKKAQEIAESRKTKERASIPPKQRLSIEEAIKAMGSDQKQLDLVVKADVQGSVEAVKEAVEGLTNDKVKVNIISAGVGGITEGDVNLAAASKGVIIGFNTRPAGKAGQLAHQEGIEIRQYKVIYDVIDDVRAAMEGLLPTTEVERYTGTAEVRAIFRISKVGSIAGCMVTKGVIKRAGFARLKRDGEQLWEGKIANLKRFKDDAKEVKEGFECGISLEGHNDVREGDHIEAYEIEKVKQKLDD